jgi:hypothetical protein
MRKRLKEEHGFDEGTDLIYTHDEGSLMRDCGVMPLPQSMGAAPGWKRYNENFVKPKIMHEMRKGQVADGKTSKTSKKTK